MPANVAVLVAAVPAIVAAVVAAVAPPADTVYDHSCRTYSGGGPGDGGRPDHSGAPHAPSG
jgi:hypothetical protein